MFMFHDCNMFISHNQNIHSRTLLIVQYYVMIQLTLVLTCNIYDGGMWGMCNIYVQIP
jgi:hypothetical protein